MKYFVIVCSILILFACSENKSLDDSMSFSLVQDTVLIDAQESIINLKYGLNNPELSSDGNFLYHYTHGEAKFDKINLRDLILEETLQFEKEGPDGMGTYIGGYTLTSADQFMIWSYGLNALFDKSGKKVRDLRLTQIAQELGGSDAFPIRLMEHPTDPNKILGLYIMWKEYEYFIVKFDLENESYEKVDLPKTEKLNDYRMSIVRDGTPVGGFGPSPEPTLMGDKMIMTNIAFNEAYIYDINLDSLYMISWNSSLTANQNEYQLPKTVEMEESEVHRKKFLESVIFSQPKWDPISQRYIRLSYKTKFGEDLDEYGRVIESGAEVFLTVLDKNLKVVKETFLDQYRKKPEAHFFLDNKIWLYENIDDELGFVRITVD